MRESDTITGRYKGDSNPSNYLNAVAWWATSASLVHSGAAGGAAVRGGTMAKRRDRKVTDAVTDEEGTMVDWEGDGAVDDVVAAGVFNDDDDDDDDGVEDDDDDVAVDDDDDDDVTDDDTDDCVTGVCDGNKLGEGLAFNGLSVMSRTSTFEGVDAGSDDDDDDDGDDDDDDDGDDGDDDDSVGTDDERVDDSEMS